MIYKHKVLFLLITLNSLLFGCSTTQDSFKTFKVEKPSNKDIFYYQKDKSLFTTYGESYNDNRNLAEEEALKQLESNRDFLLSSECLGKQRHSEEQVDVSNKTVTRFLYTVDCK